MENVIWDKNIFISFIKEVNEALILMLKTLLTSKRNKTAQGALLPWCHIQDRAGGGIGWGEQGVGAKIPRGRRSAGGREGRRWREERKTRSREAEGAPSGRPPHTTGLYWVTTSLLQVKTETRFTADQTKLRKQTTDLSKNRNKPKRG